MPLWAGLDLCNQLGASLRAFPTLLNSFLIMEAYPVGVMRRVRMPLIALCVIIASSCNDSVPAPLADVSDDQLLTQTRNWPNMLGISADDPELWRARMSRSCTEGVWDHDVALALASTFMTADEEAGLSIRVPGADEPTIELAAHALWLTAVNVCRERFPAGSIERGPPLASR